jgi:hypothetical protein
MFFCFVLFFFKALASVDNNPFLFENISKWHVIFYHSLLIYIIFCLNNSLNNKWFDFKILYWNICTIILFSTHCSLKGYMKSIMLKFDHVIT